MRKNYYLRAAALLLACCMVSLCLVTGTMAKWIMQVGDPVNKTVRAGLFSVAINTGTTAAPVWTDIVGGLSGTLAVPLTETVYQHIDTSVDYDAGVEHPHDLNGDGTPGGHGTLVKGVQLVGGVFIPDDRIIIAPGCWGEFTLSLKNYSEVDVAVTIAPGTITGGVPLEWRVKNPTTGDWGSWNPNLASVLGNAAVVVKSYPSGSGNSTTQWSREIQWRWRFERAATPAPPPAVSAEDTEDTGLGIQATTLAATTDLILNVPLDIKVTQID